jgi:hypothetical protein
MLVAELSEHGDDDAAAPQLQAEVLEQIVVRIDVRRSCVSNNVLYTVCITQYRDVKPSSNGGAWGRKQGSADYRTTE